MKYSRTRRVQWLSALLMILLVSCLLTSVVAADEESDTITGKAGSNITWVLDSSGTLTFSGSGAMSTESSQGGSIFASYRTQIKRVVIGDGITSTGMYAFDGCTNLTSVTMPDSITKISFYSFRKCSALTEIRLSRGLTTIYGSAFQGCTSLMRVEIPEGTETIYYDAFRECTALQEVVLPSTLQTIKSLGSPFGGAFEGCTSLKTVTIAEDAPLDSIPYHAFIRCTSLEKITLPKQLQQIGTGAFQDCSSLKEITLPDSLTVISNYAFHNCASLEQIDIPGSVNSFQASSTLSNSGVYAFSGCSSLERLSLGEGISIIPRAFCQNCESLADLKLPESLETVGAYAFNGCSSLRQTYLPDSVTTLGASAYAGCTGLENDLNLPQNLVSIGSKAFSDCTGLKTVEIPESVTSIGASAFSGTITEYIKVYNPRCEIRGSAKTSSLNGYVFGESYTVVYGAIGSTTETICDKYNYSFVPFSAYFVLREHTNKFRHSTDVFRAEDTTYSSCFVDKDFLNSLSKQSNKELTKQRNKTWNGSCFGICVSMLAAYNGYLPENVSSDYWDMGLASSVGSGTLRDLINYYQLCSFLDDFHYTHAYYEGFWAFLGKNENTLERTEFLEALTSEAINSEQTHKPFIMSFRTHGFNGGGHAVIVCGYHHDDENSRHVIWTYDCNSFRGKNGLYKKMYIPDDYSSFTYTDANGDAIHKNTLCLNYLSAEDFDRLWWVSRPGSATRSLPQNALSQSSGGTVGMYLNACVPFTLTNAEGQTLVYNNSTKEYTTDMVGVSCQDAGDEAFLLYMEIPESSSYTFTGFSSSFEVSLCLDGQYYSASSSGKMIRFSKENGIELSGSSTYSFTTWVGTDWGTVNLVSISGKTSGACTVKASDIGVKLDAEKKVTALQSETYTAEGVTETAHESAVELLIPRPYPSNPFSDVPASKYYYDAVLWAVENGITGGTDATHFSPNATCKREQVMTFLWAAYNRPESASDVNPFTDVKAGKYYVKPVLWAVENGITGGMSATTFGVGKACTRAQVVTFLWVAAGRPEPTMTENPFTDIKSSDYYYKAVLWALENGVTGGTSATTFGPKNNCTRAQVVTFLYAAVGKK